jgi:hypothetical protein
MGAAAVALLAAIPLLPVLPPPAQGALGARPPAPAHPVEALGARPAVDQAPALSVALELPSLEVLPDSPFGVYAFPAGGAGGPYRYGWTDTLDETHSGLSADGMIAPQTGSVGVGLTVWDALNDSADAAASVGVGPRPSIAISPDEGAGDVGLPVPFTISVFGLHPPFSVTWWALPDGPVNRSVLDGPASWEASAVTASPGFVWVEASVVDNGTSTASVEDIVADVHPRPTFQLQALAPAAEVGRPTTVTGLIAGGAPPFSWSAATDLPVGNVSGATGFAGPSSPVAWSGTFEAAGNATVRFDLEDAAGVALAANLSFRVAGSLAPQLSVGEGAAAAGSGLPLQLNLSGGVPPYVYAVNLSDGERFAGLAPGAGSVGWTLHPQRPGALVINASVHDALADVANVSVSTAVPGTAAVADAPAGGVPLSAYAGGGVGLVLLAGVALLAWRRVHRGRGPAPPDRAERAVQAVGRLVRDGEEVERLTLTVLAEEDRLTPAEVEAAVQTLRSRGQLVVETGSEGSELLRWTAGAAPPPATPIEGGRA